MLLTQRKSVSWESKSKTFRRLQNISWRLIGLGVNCVLFQIINNQNGIIASLKVRRITQSTLYQFGIIIYNFW